MGRPKHLRKKPITSSDGLRSVSSKATQSVITKYHTLRKRQSQLERQLRDLVDPSEEHAKVVQDLAQTKNELEETGGLKAYQRASLQGQSSERGGNSSVVLIPWLLQRKAKLTSGDHVRSAARLASIESHADVQDFSSSELSPPITSRHAPVG